MIRNARRVLDTYNANSEPGVQYYLGRGDTEMCAPSGRLLPASFSFLSLNACPFHLIAFFSLSLLSHHRLSRFDVVDKCFQLFPFVIVATAACLALVIGLVHRLLARRPPAQANMNTPVHVLSRRCSAL